MRKVRLVISVIHRPSCHVHYNCIQDRQSTKVRETHPAENKNQSIQRWAAQARPLGVCSSPLRSLQNLCHGSVHSWFLPKLPFRGTLSWPPYVPAKIISDELLVDFSDYHDHWLLAIYQSICKKEDWAGSFSSKNLIDWESKGWRHSPALVELLRSSQICSTGSLLTY